MKYFSVVALLVFSLIASPRPGLAHGPTRV